MVRIIIGRAGASRKLIRGELDPWVGIESWRSGRAPDSGSRRAIPSCFGATDVDERARVGATAPEIFTDHAGAYQIVIALSQNLPNL
jgi:hypothetical protein